MENEKKKKSRSSNFTAAEKSMLLRLALQQKAMLECKRTDAATNLEKARCWQNIAEQFNASSSGPPRDMKMLRSKYEKIKIEIRKTDFPKEWKKTGGGPRETGDANTRLTEEEKELREIIILGCSGMQPNRSDSDRIVCSGVLPSDIGEDPLTVIATGNEDEQLVDTDWADSTPAMLQTQIHPLLRPAEIADLNDIRVDVNSPQGTSASAPQSGRRRPVLRKRTHASAGSKFEQLAEMRLKVVADQQRFAQKQIEHLDEMHLLELNHKKEIHAAQLHLINLQQSCSALEFEVLALKRDKLQQQLNVEIVHENGKWVKPSGQNCACEETGSLSGWQCKVINKHGLFPNTVVSGTGSVQVLLNCVVLNRRGGKVSPVEIRYKARALIILLD